MCLYLTWGASPLAAEFGLPAYLRLVWSYVICMLLAADVAGRTFGSALCLARLSVAGLPLVSTKLYVTKVLADRM